MTILPKLINLFSSIPIKLPRYFFTELEKNYNKVHLEEQKVKNLREIMKNVKEGGLAVPDLKLYYKAVVIKTIWYWLKDRRENQWNRLLGVSDLSKTVDDKSKELSLGDKNQLFDKNCWENWKTV